MSNRIKRKRWMKGYCQESAALAREMGFEHLLVTGEHQAKVGMDYRRHSCPA